MIFATFDIDLLDDPQFLALERKNGKFPWLFLRCVQVAKRANKRGQIVGRSPFGALDLAMIHSRRPEDEALWQEFLDAATDLGLLTFEHKTYTIADWSRWHRRPSDDPENVAERVALHRVTTRYTDDVTESPHVTTQIRSDKTQIRSSSSLPPPPIATFASFASCTARSEEEGTEEAAADLHSVVRDHAAIEVQLRSGIGRLLADTGTRARIDLSRILAWSGDDLRAGRVLVADVLTAIRYGLEQTRDLQARGQEIRQPWRYALAIAEEKLDAAVRRRVMTEEARAQGLPIPRPLIYIPEQGGAS